MTLGVAAATCCAVSLLSGQSAPDVKEEPLSRADSAFRFRYTGLRLLDHIGGHYFLVSDGWTPRYGVVITLSDTDPVRLEFVRDRRPTQQPATRG